MASVFLPPADLLKAHSALPFAAVATLIAVLWVLGLAVQAVGVRCGLKYSEKYPPPTDFHKAQRQFRSIRGNQTADVQRFERFEAIREAYANGAASIVLSFVLWVVLGYVLDSGQSLPLVISVFVVSAVVFTALWLGQKETIRNFDAFWELAIVSGEES